MDCFPDYCLGCDKTASDGLYCSEACRMHDLERAGSVPASPPYTSSSGNHFVFPSTSGQPPSRYPPPPTKSLSSASLHSRGSTSTHKYNKSSGSHSAYSSPHRVLSPSSSRSSLVSNGVPEAVSEEAAKELLSYFNAFDRTRDQRRRSLPLKDTTTQLSTLRSFPEAH